MLSAVMVEPREKGQMRTKAKIPPKSINLMQNAHMSAILVCSNVCERVSRKKRSMNSITGQSSAWQLATGNWQLATKHLEVHSIPIPQVNVEN